MSSSFFRRWFEAGQVCFFAPMTFGDFLVRPTKQLPFPLNVNANQIRHTFNGSAAIYQAAKAIELKAGDRVLLPAYCCGAELGPFQHLGCHIDFYSVDEDTQVNVDDLISRLDANTRLVYVTHYYGIPQYEIERIAELCREQEIPLLEDCALALYSSLGNKSLGGFGDYAIFSQRKFLPITEGGLLVSNRKPLPADMLLAKRPPLIPFLDRLLGSLAQGLNAQRSPGLTNRIMLGLLFLCSMMIKCLRVAGQRIFDSWKTPEAEGEIAVPIYDYGMMPWMFRQFRATDHAEVVRKRREIHDVWMSLLDELPPSLKCRPITADLPDGACPLFFVVLTPEPKKLVEFLDSRGIEASQWWATQRVEIDWAEHANLQPLKSQMVVIPTHHRINGEELRKRIASPACRATALTV